MCSVVMRVIGGVFELYFGEIQMRIFPILAKLRGALFYSVLIGGACVLHREAFSASAFNKKDPVMLEIDKNVVDAPSYIDALELVGVGISVETWRNHPNYPKFNLWTEIEEGQGRYIISKDAEAYPKSYGEAKMIASKRAGDAIEAALQEFMDRYPLPISVVGPSWGEAGDEDGREKSRRGNASWFVTTKHSGPYTARGEFSGLLTQSGQIVNSYLNDEPDLLWQTIFGTFDKNGDIPAVGIAAMDGALRRALGYYEADTQRFENLATEQVYRPKQPRIVSDNWTFLTLVRRGRIERLRQYAPLVKDTMKVESFPGEGPARNWSEFAGWKSRPQRPFVPTPYLPEPWTPFQIDQYDHLENLGTLHRPQVVSYLDEKGAPVKAAERLARFETALRTALTPLGGKLPARIFYDYGSVWDDRSSANRFLPLVQSLQVLDAEFDLLDPKRGYDLARILGDTGAGSPFVAVAVATMASKQSGGPSLVANLRRNDGATLLLITPPSPEQLAKDAAIKRPFWPRR